MKEFLTGNVIFLESDPDTTLTGPGTTRSVITAAYYNGDENSIDINSGRGYTRLNNVKPDFAVPGVNVTGALPGGRFAERSRFQHRDSDCSRCECAFAGMAVGAGKAVGGL